MNPKVISLQKGVLTPVLWKRIYRTHFISNCCDNYFLTVCVILSLKVLNVYFKWHIHCCTFSEHMSRDHAMHQAVTYKRIKTIENYLSMRPHFLWVYQRDNRRGKLGEQSDLQAVRVLSQHPKWVVKLVNP